VNRLAAKRKRETDTGVALPRGKTYFLLETSIPGDRRYLHRHPQIPPMVTKDDIEGFLDRLEQDGASYKEVEPVLWVVKPGGELDFDMVVHYSPPDAVLRVKLIELPTEKIPLAEMSRRLLELNASDLVHGSYGIEQNSNSIVLTEALELEHLDFEEFLAAYESMTLALASHLREIGSFRGGK
jgi:hypothetical protein